ncbi:MAG: alpha-amylase [Verrucomicrobia bacterium]|jgi:glycosidase|nr:alpha-amylase [Verrucomicrobiota bacterium]
MKQTPFPYRSLFLSGLAALLSPALPAAEELLWTQPSTELPAWMRDEVVYEVNVRQYSEEGTFDALTADLGRLEALGVGTLWLMPIHPIGEENRKGPLGSYYAVKDYYGINPEFGTKEDFAEFVEAATARGMRIILDWVGNHTAWDNPLAEERPDFYLTDDNGRYQPPTGFDWTDVIQLDFENPEVLAYQIEAMRYWINEYGIDGFRCDYATGVPTSFWNEMSAALLATEPELFLLAEAEVPDHQLEAFHASYGWSVLAAFDAIAQGKAPASHLDDVLAKVRLQFPAGSDFLYMTSNHDVNSWEGTVFERLGGGAEVFAVLSYMLDGIPLLYNGQEAGMDKRLLFFERDPIDWRPHEFHGLYRRLNRLKSGHPALAVGAPSLRIPSTADGEVYALLREAEGRQLLFIGNLTPHDTEVRLGSSELAGEWTDVFTGQRHELASSSLFSLRSWGYHVLQTSKSEQP